MSEDEIVHLLRERNEKGIEYMYEQYSNALYGIIYRIVQKTEVSEELLQETFVKVWNNFSSYDPNKGRLFTWTLNIARNLAIDRIRSADHRSSQKIQDIDSSINFIQTQQPVQYVPEHIDLKDLVEKLRPEQKELVDLIYFSGYTQAEAAARLKIPLGTVKTRVRSAMMELRKYFKIA